MRRTHTHTHTREHNRVLADSAAELCSPYGGFGFVCASDTRDLNINAGWKRLARLMRRAQRLTQNDTTACRPPPPLSPPPRPTLTISAPNRRAASGSDAVCTAHACLTCRFALCFLLIRTRMSNARARWFYWRLRPGWAECEQRACARGRNATGTDTRSEPTGPMDVRDGCLRLLV